MSRDAEGPALDRAIDLVRFLRARCPWDAAQTPTSLLPYLLEEAHEAAEAVSDGDDALLAKELGDLLLNVAFQVVLAEERAAFTAEDVVTQLEAKMRRRHPHLYGLGPQQDWETLKAQERAEAAARDAAGGDATDPSDPPASILAGLARGLEPLSRAHRIQDRVSTVGFDWTDPHGAFEKVTEEMEEVREALEAGASSLDEEPSPALEEELGDLLFAVVNLSRLSGVHAMRALQRANEKFIRRFEALEQRAHERGVVLGTASLDELEELWVTVKQDERG